MIIRFGFGIGQISAQFADVNQQRATFVSDFLQKIRGRELSANEHTRTRDHGCPSPNHEACAMIERQTNIHSILFGALEPSFCGHIRAGEVAAV